MSVPDLAADCDEALYLWPGAPQLAGELVGRNEHAIIFSITLSLVSHISSSKLLPIEMKRIILQARGKGPSETLTPFSCPRVFGPHRM